MFDRLFDYIKHPIPEIVTAAQERRRALAGPARARAGAALLALTGALALPATAEAQTPTTLVGNIGQTASAFSTTVSISQRFTTGANQSGYTLTGVDVASAAYTRFTARVCETDASGHPTTRCTDLAAPASFFLGTMSFSAPANTTLRRNTTYAVVVHRAGGSQDYGSTHREDEDAGHAGGWSIADNYEYFGTEGWDTTTTDALRIAIKGYAAGGTTPACPLYPGDIWCAMVTVADLAGLNGYIGAINAGDLSEEDFRVGPEKYTIDSVFATDSGALSFSLTSALTDDHRARLVLYVEGESDPFPFSTAGYSSLTYGYRWDGRGLDWQPGSTVTLHLWFSNNAPVFSNDTATRTVPENSAAGAAVGTPVTATDADSGDTLTYSLEGPDAASFTIDETSGQVRTGTGVTYNYEAPKNSYSVTVTADDGNGRADTIDVTINVTDDDTEAPGAPGAPTVSAASVSSLTVTWTAPANDGPPITDYDYRYRRTATQGAWTAVTGTTITGLSATIRGLADDTSYDVQVRATNAEGTGEWSAAGASATDANTAPVFTSPATFEVVENRAAVGTVRAVDSDAEDTVTGYLITRVLAQPFFEIDGTTGALTFITAPNFEDPQDRGADNTYEVSVRASSGEGERVKTATQTITVTVTDDDTEVPGAPGAPNVSAASMSSLDVSWAAPANVGPPITDYDYRYRTAAAQGAWTEVTGTTITGLSATIRDLAENTSYDVQVRATNAEGAGAWSASGRGATFSASGCTLNPGDIWCGVVTVGDTTATGSPTNGFMAATGEYPQVGNLSGKTFTYGMNTYTIDMILVESAAAGLTEGVFFSLTSRLTASDKDALVMHVDGSGSAAIAFDHAVSLGSYTYYWIGDRITEGTLVSHGPGLDWSSETTVTVRLRERGEETPDITDVAITSTPLLTSSEGSAPDTYGAGATIRFTLTFSARVTVTGRPRYTFEIDRVQGQSHRLVYARYESGSGTNALVFAYEVRSGDRDGNGILLLNGNNSPQGDGPVYLLIGEYIFAFEGGADADLAWFGRTGTRSGHKVDGSRTTDNYPPRFTSDAAFEVGENRTAVGTVTAVDSDAEDTVTGYAITGGADQALFSIYRSTGALDFLSAPNFEDAQDQDADNRYEVTVQASSGTLEERVKTATQVITVTVTDAYEPPDKPARPMLAAASGSYTSLDASWTEPGLNGGPDITGYGVQYRQGTGGTWTDSAHSGDGVTATITGLVPGTSYQVRVQALTGKAPSAWSDASTAASTNDLPTLSVENASADEGGNVTFTVTLSEAARENLTATWTASIESGDTAEEADFVDLSAATRTEMIMEDRMTATFTVVTADDTRDEDEETFTVTLSVKANEALAATTTARGTIKDDDEPPTVSIGDATALEHGTMFPRVTLSAVSEKVVTIFWTASIEPDDTAAAADFVDLSATTGSVTFNPGTFGRPGTALVLAFPMYDMVADDALDEDDETFTVTLSNPTNAILAPDSSTGRMTIRDNDPEPSVSVDDAVAFEGDALEFTVRLSPVSGRDVMVDWATSDGIGDTATSGMDFTAANDTLTIAAGETAGTITVLTTDDPTDEPNETFTVTLSNPRNAEISDATATGAITDNDEPNAAPAFTSPATFAVAENGTTVGTVTAADRDAGDVITGYAITGGADAGLFSIGATSGALTFDAAPNYEDEQDQGNNNRYEVTVQASSGAGEREKTATQAITVTVTDDDTEAPGAPDAPNVSAASVSSLSVTWTAPANDGPPITHYEYNYRRTSPPGGSWQAVTDTLITGLSATIRGLAEDTSYDVRVRATNAEGTGAWSASGAGVTDANAAPAFISDAAFEVAENGTAVGTVTAADSDAEDAVSGYAITGGADQGFFSIGSASGTLTFDDAPNYEDAQDQGNNNRYEVTVQASSGAAARVKTATQTITVTVTDDNTEAPGAPGAPNVSAASVSSLSVTWAAPDNDGPAVTDYDYRYRRTSPPGGSWQAVTDTLITGLSATIQSLDENTSYDVQVRATNAEGTGAWSASGAGATDANAAPAFSSSATFDVPENGTEVAMVMASDSDAEDAVSGYAITGGADQGFFSIGSASGALTFDAAPNYEDAQDQDTDNDYEVTVQASSGTGEREKTATQAITVTVTDDNTEAPGAPGAPNVSAVSVSSLSVTWAAPDNEGPAVTDYDYRYRTTASQGVWTAVTGTTITGLSATIRGLAENTSYDVQVRATNAEGTGAWSASGRAATDANAAPAFTSDAAFEVAENRTAVGTVRAADSDAEDAVTGYAITAGADQALFEIDRTTGALTFRTAPNYEDAQDQGADNDYEVTVQASSGEGEREKTATQTITVTVTDDNTEAPGAPGAPNVSAVSVSSLSVTWAAPDNDGPAVTDYDYRYRTASPPGGSWQTVTDTLITGLSATIRDLAENTSYDVQVRATNAEGTGAWSASGRAATDANAAPAFTSDAAFEVAENRTAVGTVRAADRDTEDAVSGYAITAGADQALFEIDGTTGALTFRTAPNYEDAQDQGADNDYEVTVQASSGEGEREKTATQAITVTVTDDDAEAPGAPGAPNVSAASVSSLRVTWAAPDNDGPPITDYDYIYQITSSPGGWTPVTDTPIAGLSTTIQGLAEDTSYDVRVRARNAEGSGEWSASGRAATDANAAPVFTSDAAFEVAENRTAVGTVRAADRDAEDAVSGYAITAGADQALFEIDGTTGALTFRTAPNFEDEQDQGADNRYEVTVQASSGTEARVKTATQTITVTVTDADEQPARPARPTLAAVPGSSTSLTASWTRPGLNGGPDITDYDYRYRTASPPGAWTAVTDTAITGLSTTIQGLAENTEYQVQVRAYNGEINSDWSDPSDAVRTNAADTPIPQGPAVTLHLSDEDGSVFEDAGWVTVTATVSPASPVAFTVTVSVTPVAPATDADLQLSANRVLRFDANETESTGTVRIRPVDDNEPEPPDVVTVSGAVSSEDIPDPDDVTLTILNDDVEAFDVAVDAPAAVDEDAGTATVTYTLTTRQNSVPVIDVDMFYNWDRAETATRGGDYTPPHGRTFGAFVLFDAVPPSAFSPNAAGTAWVAERTFSIGIVDDRETEADETIVFHLDAGSSRYQSPTQTITIRDDDDTVIRNVRVVSGPGADGVWSPGERVELEVRYNYPVVVEQPSSYYDCWSYNDDGTCKPPGPFLVVGFRSDARPGYGEVLSSQLAPYEGGSGTATLRFAYTVGAAEDGARGVWVADDGMLLRGATIRPLGGGDAELSEYTNTRVMQVTVQASGRAWTAGETVRVKVRFTGPPQPYTPDTPPEERLNWDKVDVAGGAPTIRLLLGDRERRTRARTASYVGGSGTNTLVFEYEVAAGDGRVGAVEVEADSLASNGATIRNERGYDAELDHLGAVQYAQRPALSVADAEATEGEDATLDFVVRLDGNSGSEVTVDYRTRDGTAESGFDYTETSGRLTFAPGEYEKTVSVPIRDDAVDDDGETFTLLLGNVSGAGVANDDYEAVGTIRNSETTATVAGPADDAPPLTVRFVGMPAAHRGEGGFKFRVAFSEDIGISFQTLREDAFTVTGGRVTGGKRVDDRRDMFEMTVRPDSDDDVTITLQAGRECAVSGAICTKGENRRKLTNTVSATVAGPADDALPPNRAATGAPTISGTARVREGLTASPSGIADADGLDNASFAYQWIRNDTDIRGATGATYTPVDADAGERLKVRVNFTDDAGHAESLTSAATGPVEAAAQANTPAQGRPAIAGTARVGETLSASTSGISDADGLDNAEFAYQWIRGGADIPGATGADYTAAAADAGERLKVRVAFADAAGHAESLTSAATGPVEAAARANTPAQGRPAIAGTARVGETLSASTSGITDADGLDHATFAYQWLRGDDEIAGAIGRTYTAAEADEGERLKVRVAFADAAGHDESLTSASTKRVAARPRPKVSVADARVREAAGATLDFAVTLDRSAPGPVTVDYRTLDASAKAGEDYEARAGTLAFAAGETAKTLRVTVLDDAHDEGDEKMVVVLEPGPGVDRGDRLASGTIVNSDPLPKGWLARFGRTGATQVVGLLDTRFDEASSASSQLTLGGRSWRLSDLRGRAHRPAAPDRSAHADCAGGTGVTGPAAERPATAEVVPAAACRARMTGRAPGGSTDSAAVPAGGQSTFFSPASAGSTGAGAVLPGAARPDPAQTATPPHGAVRAGAEATWLERTVWGLLTRRDWSLDRRRFLSQSGFNLDLSGIGNAPVETEVARALPEPTGRWSAWGRGALTRFRGEDAGVRLDGDVLTGLLGVDYARARWLAGVALAYNDGDGTYRAPARGNSAGTLDSVLVSVHPYLQYQVTPRLSAWGALGYGEGELRLRPEHGTAGAGDGLKSVPGVPGVPGESESMETGMRLGMGALGLRGVVYASQGTELTVKSDALWVRTAAKAAHGLQAVDAADASRVRLLLSGRHERTLANAATLAPGFELGLRYDDGDAETGFGIELGGGLRYADPGRGLTLETRARTLLAHEDGGYEEWGLSGSLSLDPGRPGRGLALRLDSGWGSTNSGTEALWRRQTTAGLAPQHEQAAQGRIRAEWGYGLDVPWTHGLLTPYGSLELSGASRTTRLGWRFELGQQLNLDLAGERLETAHTRPEHGLMLRMSLPW